MSMEDECVVELHASGTRFQAFDLRLRPLDGWRLPGWVRAPGIGGGSAGDLQGPRLARPGHLLRADRSLRRCAARQQRLLATVNTTVGATRTTRAAIWPAWRGGWITSRPGGHHALWLTPPVANQWWNPTGRHTGYHGYWAEHFTKVDRHLGTLADYQRLAKGCTAAAWPWCRTSCSTTRATTSGYRGGWSRPPIRPRSMSAMPARRRWPRRRSRRSTSTTRDPAQRAAGIYHWTPDISNYNDARQEHEFQMSGWTT